MEIHQQLWLVTRQQIHCEFVHLEGYTFVSREEQKMDAKECPWCFRWCMKDNACNYIFACGLDEKNIFHASMGCGRSWCWECGKKFCSQYYLANGKKSSDAKESHANCCEKEENFSRETFCSGGHNSHCDKRW